MATAAPSCSVSHIGDTAGTVWNELSKSGPLSMAQLVKAVGEPRDCVMLALGWLAREGKISIDEESRRKTVSLC